MEVNYNLPLVVVTFGANAFHMHSLKCLSEKDQKKKKKRLGNHLFCPAECAPDERTHQPGILLATALLKGSS